MSSKPIPVEIRFWPKVDRRGGVSAQLALVPPGPVVDERVYGSRRFRSIGRNLALKAPERFEPTVKRAGDIVL